MKDPKSRAVIILALLAMLGLGKCGSYNLYVMENLLPEAQIVVDGRTDDWRGALSMIEDGNASLGVTNDDRNLFVCLTAESRLLQAQILFRGLTVWFDPRAGTKKVVGIRYPLGAAEGRGEQPEPEGFKSPPEGPLPGDTSILEIIGPQKKSSLRMAAADVEGVEVKLARSNGLLVYEIKVPLVRTAAQPFAVGAFPGQIIAVGLETGSPADRRIVRRPLGGLPPMGGDAGYERGARAGGYDMTPDVPKGLKLWARVQLTPASGNRLAAPLASITLNTSNFRPLRR
jgi:hypothetical protein